MLSSSAVLLGAAYGAGDQTWNGRNLKLVMEDTFDGALDLKKWEQEVSLWGGGVSLKSNRGQNIDNN